jgi:two-component system, OmpR family, response regulator
VHVLLVEPDPAIAAFARRALRAHGRVDVVGEGGAAIELLRGARDHDAVAVAATLADGSGYDACRRMREAGIWTTVLMLVDEGDSIERSRECGADGYLRKPFSGARLLAAFDDVSGDAPHAGVPAAGLVLHPETRSVTKRDVEVLLSPTEFVLLELLARNAGDVVDRPRLLEHAWSYDYANSSNVVDVYLRRIREKIDRPFGTDTIETVRGRGFRMVDAV